MKKMLLSGLLVSLMWTGWAQNRIKMTDAEKKQALEELELLYRFETCEVFSGVDAEKPRRIEQMRPWLEWAHEYRNRQQEVEEFFQSLASARVEPAREDPSACVLMMSGNSGSGGNYSFRMSAGVWDNHYRLDSLRNCLGFRKEMFYGLDVEVEISLEDRNGRAVYIDTTREIRRLEGRRASEQETGTVWAGI